jgi:hypothetical protein
LEFTLQIARNFQPFTESEQAAIREKTAPLQISGDGRFELYKTSMLYDADPGRAIHGFPSLEEGIK